MATLFRSGSDPQPVAPASGQSFTLEELQAFVGGYIEAVYPGWSERGQPLVLFVNEDGKRLGLPFNRWATVLMRGRLRADDCIVGPAVLCTFEEAGETR